VTLVVQKLARALVRRGHQVLVITASERGEPYSDEDEGVQLERRCSIKNPFWSEGPMPWATASTLAKLIRRFQPDLIHTHENALLSLQLLRLRPQLGVPRISSCYYLPRYVTQYLPGGGALEAILWKYTISNLNRYEHIIFSTRTQQEEFMRQGLHAPSTAISNGVDTRRYYPPDGHIEDVESTYQLPPRPRILFVGRLMKDKKIDVLIRAMQQVCAGQEAHLLIVGRGNEHRNLQSQARLLGLEHYVHLLGYVPESDLPAIYRSADLFAIASVCEVQSIPTLQAVATGLPIVAVDAAALPELVRPEQNGLLVPPDDVPALGGALRKVVSDPAYCAALGRASLELLDGHSEERTFRKYEELYRGLVERANKA
jgi:glycosyltransferase involved in cell wall biosynthesis